MRTVLLSVCAGAIGGLFVVLAARFATLQTTLATVDLQKILSEHIAEVGNRNLDKDATVKEATAYADALQRSLDELAADQHLLILPAPAVLRGAPDLTEVLTRHIEQRLSQTGGPK